jgi:hypothetical protein
VDLERWVDVGVGVRRADDVLVPLAPMRTLLDVSSLITLRLAESAALRPTISALFGMRMAAVVNGGHQDAVAYGPRLM